MTHRAYIVDDHAVLRLGVRWLLESTGDFQVVGEAGTAPAALEGIVDTRPDIALVDVRLGAGDGVEVVREVRARCPEVRCIVLTSFVDETAFFQSVVAGAFGYIIKDRSPTELVEACRSVAAGHHLMNREVVDDLRRRATSLPEDDHLLAELTPQEQRILSWVTQGLTNREIAAELALAEKTVRNYVSSLLGKLHMKNRTEAATYVARTAARRAEREYATAG